jgi:hypothetical protein
MRFFSKDTTKSFTSDLLMVIIFMIFSNISGRRLTRIMTYIYEKIRPKYSVIDIIGWEFLDGNTYTYDYPQNMIAVNHYIYENNKSKCFRYFDNKRNAVYDSFAYKSKDTDLTPNYLLGEVYNIKIDDDLYVTVAFEELNTQNGENKTSTFNWKIKLSIRSYKHDMNFIQNFIDKCTIHYENYMMNKNKNKTYHFIFQGKKKNELSFSSVVISDFNNPEQKNYETFDNMFHSNKQMLINDVDRLHDINYYKKTGLKRKKGYLFYGHPGTGKTASVMSMSNYDHRHIIEVPLSRVKTNCDLEAILTLNHINDVKFKPENVIILFDEIDIGMELNRKNPEAVQHSLTLNEQTKSKIEEPFINDKLNFGTLLSRLDGVGNYAGLIIVATCNNIGKIDKALYRDGRLNLVKFDFASFDDISNIIERYYDIKTTSELREKINKLSMKISHAKLRCKLEHYDDPTKLLDYIIEKLDDLSDSDSSIAKPSIFIDEKNKDDSETDDDDDE